MMEDPLGIGMIIVFILLTIWTCFEAQKEKRK